eukprot:TRINITY_DN12531_c9_g1_i4.p3 TRINITY_DN12531_c9_g1~~TRINITY_DN12531_c9_g1_i4.p3  ORF type:complete len:138 (+),score=23.75 TRINITY_DN12531_c9_g1_i4:84-497(+)
MATLEEAMDVAQDEELDQEILNMPADDILMRVRLLDDECKIMRSEIGMMEHETLSMRERIKENAEKIKMHKSLPYLVSTIVELLDNEEDPETDGAAGDADAQRKGKCVVIKTSTRQVRCVLSLVHEISVCVCVCRGV